jgi:hypothetical protein
MGWNIVLKVFSLIVAVYGTIDAFVMWFLPHFSLESLTMGLAILFLNSLIFVAELRPSFYIENYLGFLLLPYGRCAFLASIGALYANIWALWISCWVIYWVLAFVYFIIGIIGDPLATELMTGGFKPLPNATPIVPVGVQYYYVAGGPPQQQPTTTIYVKAPGFVPNPEYVANPEYEQPPEYVNGVNVHDSGSTT